jgi:ankyrin repeat protein
MMKRIALSAAAAACLIVLGVATRPFAQPPATTGGPNFATAIRPIFANRCVSCHGPNVQRAGLRLDDRDAALKGSISGPVIVPGDSAKSKLYQMVAGKKMPLDDELSVLELGDLKAWIDAGANWPAKRAIPNLTVDPRIEALRVALRNQDQKSIKALLSDPSLVKARGKNGITALHQVAVYGDAAQAKALLDNGADVNATDLDGVTPLIWGVRDTALANLLIDRGADVNATSDAGFSPLVAASGLSRGEAVVRRLIEKGAKVAPQQQPRMGAAIGLSGNMEIYRLVFPKVLDINGPGAATAANNATVSRCMACLDYLISQGAKGKTLADPLVEAANSGDTALVKRLLDLGATLDGKGPQDAGVLIAAAMSDREPMEKVRLLTAAGADVNAKDAHGRTPLSVAKLLHPELVPVLTAKGAK